VHRINERIFLIGRGSAQLSSSPLVVGEQFAVGGADSVRGYNQSQFLGDDGVNVSLEARFSPLRKNFDKFQVAVFADHGTVTLKTPAAGQSKTQNITGLGVGLRANLPHDLSVRADLGFHVSNRPDSGGTAFPYIQLMKRF
jgi:hemolysin activation/secretion protein